MAPCRRTTVIWGSHAAAPGKPSHSGEAGPPAAKEKPMRASAPSGSPSSIAASRAAKRSVPAATAVQAVPSPPRVTPSGEEK